ncbi:MAG TPA: sensor domain-containing diguanylate cyclase [Micromonosporaceae bacterium]
MSLDLERIVDAAADRLRTASTVAEACHEVAHILGRHGRVMVAVLLRVRDRLRCVAATGSWHVFSSLPFDTGVIGRAYRTDRTQIVTEPGRDPDYFPLAPDVAVEICAPIRARSGLIGVLNLEWTSPVELELWRKAAERIAACLGERIDELGGPPTESDSEKLLRHAVTLTNASSEGDLVAATLDAARDVSGLDAAVLVLTTAGGRPAIDQPTPAGKDLESRIGAELRAQPEPQLAQLVSLAHRQGTSYTLGEVGHAALPGYDVLVRAGARTVITVPFGPAAGGGVLLVADLRLLRPDPTTVNLMEMLAAQAWACLDRLRTLAQLHRQAISDPLTGLRHHGQFGQRIATAMPGRTALLVIDVDEFKSVNDTYGHEAGDRVLVRLARTMEASLRHGDELYRVGGDEFVAVVEVTRPEEALGIAQRLAAAVRRTGQTISVGVALRRDGETPKQTLRRADIALYEVKRQGRDSVRLASP